MEIGPINAVRPVTMVKPLRSDVDIAGVFAVEFRKKAEDATYSLSQQRAVRGLEDEAAPDDDLQEESDSDSASSDSFRPVTAVRKINFLA